MTRLLSFLALVALGFAGCASGSHGTVTVPVVPAWVQPSDARTFTTAEVLAECQRLAPFAVVETSDATFTPIAHAWLEQAVVFARDFAFATGLDEFQAESWDCDKFALAFGLVANVAAKRARVRAQPLLARIHVHQSKAFGNVAAGGGHALNAFLSDRGLYVYEPQSRTLVPLAAYPNRETVFRIKIGG